MTRRTGPRVVVVGSGVAGAATAFALARSGAAVTVLESGETGTATAAGAGIVQPWTSSAEGPFYELYAAGRGLLPAGDRAAPRQRGRRDRVRGVRLARRGRRPRGPRGRRARGARTYVGGRGRRAGQPA